MKKLVRIEIETAYNNERCSYNCIWLDSYMNDADYYCHLFSECMDTNNEKKHPDRCQLCIDGETN